MAHVLYNKRKKAISTTLYTRKNVIASTSKGDANAISIVFDTYSQPLLGYIFKILGNKSISEDILISIFRHLPALLTNYNEKGRDLFTTLINISRNYAVDFLIEKNNRESMLSDLQQQKVATYIYELSLFQRTVYALLYIRGYDINEVSAILNVSVKFIKLRFKLLHKYPEN